MNRLQSLTPSASYCVTLNRTEAIDPERVLSARRVRPPGVHARAAWRRSGAGREISGATRTHYCGAYWGYGFHEDGVRERAARLPSVRGRL